MKSKFRATILCGLLVAQLVTVLALVLVSGRITGAAETEHKDALLEQAAAETADRVRSHVEPVESIVEITAALASEPGVGAEEFQRTFSAALASTPQMAGVFVGRPDGGFVDVRRDGDGTRIKSIEIDDAGERTVTLRFYDERGILLRSEEDPTDTFDPRTRPWYQKAQAKRGQVAWTDPYVFFTSREPGITAAMTIMQNDQVAGVVAADIELGSLSSFLGSRTINNVGGTVIVNELGFVIAHPDPTLVQTEDANGTRTVSISELDDPFARAAVGSLVGVGGAGNGTHQFEVDGIGNARAAFRSVPVDQGGWTVGVFAPDGELVPGLASARSQERWLTIVVGILSVLLAGLMALSLTRPLGELETRASTDALTGLPNRRTSLEAADRAMDSGTTIGAAILDLDYFKLINDTYGHLVGDEVLVGVARRIQAAVRDGEAHVGRIGGEEFLVLFSETKEADAITVCERIIERIRSKSFATSVGLIDVTASIGLAVVDSGGTVSQLMARADASLLEAKQSGRDQLVLHREAGAMPADPESVAGPPGAHAESAEPSATEHIVRAE